MEAFNDAQQTPLLLAIVSGQVQAALTLMESGASLEVVDLDHKNPLHLATEKENMILLKVRHFHALLVIGSLVPRPRPKIGKGAWLHLQTFSYVLSQHVM